MKMAPSPKPRDDHPNCSWMKTLVFGPIIPRRELEDVWPQRLMRMTSSSLLADARDQRLQHHESVQAARRHR